MVVPHYPYLALKIPGPKGVITVKGSFEVSDTCDKEFNRMVQTFGMTAEYARLNGETDHNVLLDVGQSLPDRSFEATQDSKKVRVHPTDLAKTTSIAVNLDPHRKARSSSSSVSVRKSAPGVLQTCQGFPGNFSSTHSMLIQK
jgi:hypothetical protein